MNAQAGVYLLIDRESQANQNPARYGYSEQDRRRYESNAMEEDTRILYTDNFELGKVYREFEYVPDRATLLQGAWNRFELETYGLLWNMAARISTHALWADFISINRQEILGPYSDDDKAALQYLLPHMSRGAELHRLVTRLEQLYGAVLAVLDKLLVGLVVLDMRGRVVLANTVARRTVEESGALRITSAGRLRATDAAVDLNLRELIVTTMKTVQESGMSDGGTLVAAAGPARDDVLLEVMPIRDDGLPDRDNVRGVAVFIIDPNHSLPLNTAGLARIFSLSPAEHAVTDALVNGAKPNEIAEERGTSFETVRSQIKAVYRKTGATSGSDLIRLAAKANPPIDRE